MNLTAFFALLGGLLVLAFAANRLFSRTRVPDVIVLLAIGLLLGPGLGWIDVSGLESTTNAFGTLALILILFEGGLELDVRDTLRHFPGALLLAILAYTFSLGLVALLSRWSFNLSWPSALLVGAVLGCSSSSIVLPLLQQMRVREPVKITLLIESSLGDVLAVISVGILLDLRTHGGSVMGGFLTGLLSQIVVAALLALTIGIVWSRLLPLLSEQRFWHVLTFAVVLLLYAMAEALHSSGLIAVLGFGLTLANFPGIDPRVLEAAVQPETTVKEPHTQVLTFHSELAFLVRTFFFVLLGMVVQVDELKTYLLPALGILGTLFVARWLAIQMCRWSWRGIEPGEREVILWVLPRGLITAVLAIQVLQVQGNVFGFLPDLAFAVIVVTNLLVMFGTIRARHRSPIVQKAGVSESLP
ncbi:MAG: cation:proton antiporter [Acidobacteria bacterium]|nr:cation:proton antiporter [Acidobacteriota bacterium]